MNTAVLQIQQLVDLGLLPRAQAGALIDELEAVQFGTRKPGSLRHLRAQYLCGRISAETYHLGVRQSQVGWGVLVMLGLMGIALVLCLRDPGCIPSRDMVLPSYLAFGMGIATTALVHLAGRASTRKDVERRRALEAE